MYVNVIDTLQKKLSDYHPPFGGKKSGNSFSKPWAPTVTNWGPSPAVDRVIHWQYLGMQPKKHNNLGDIVLGPGILVSGFWNLRSFLVGRFSWVESTISVWKLCSLELLAAMKNDVLIALAVHLHLHWLTLQENTFFNFIHCCSLFFIAFILLYQCMLEYCSSFACRPHICLYRLDINISVYCIYSCIDVHCPHLYRYMWKHYTCMYIFVLCIQRPCAIQLFSVQRC